MSEGALALAMVDILGALLAAILSNQKDSMRFDVPFCERCRARRRKFNVQHVDWEKREATLLVHVEFKKRLVDSGYYDRRT